MFRRAIAFALAVQAVLTLSPREADGGEATTPVQTASIPMTATDWSSGTGGITDPLTFAAFNPDLGTLTGVAISMSATIRNDYILDFPGTLSPTTLYVATTLTTNPSVLSNPVLVQQLTDGPTVSLMAPDGTSSIFAGPGATLPVDVVTKTEPSGTYSSYVSDTSPNYIAPTQGTLSLSLTLDASNGASLMPEFVGTGSIDLPIAASAYSSFYTSTGNGGGAVLTSADATVTVQYFYTPFAPAPAVPEPSGLLLLGLGAGLGGLAARRGVARSRRGPDPDPAFRLIFPAASRR